MYQNPAQAQSWNPNGAPPGPQQNWAQQPPTTPNGTFASRQSTTPNQLPTLQSQGGAPTGQPGQPMQTLQPQQHPEQYRQLPQLPPPHQAGMYQAAYQAAPQMPYAAQQPAPRQRTAIACRYCRRRKIRCSGFEQNEEGRCTNCQRFSQECVFTPVSAQTQTFVPAHTVWRNQNPPPNTQLYGAYGQPLPQHGNRDPYPTPQQPGQYPPPPQGYHPNQMAYPGGQQPPDQSSTPGTKRGGTDEPHTPTLPPSGVPNAPRDGQYAYPDPMNPGDKTGPDGASMVNGGAPMMVPARPRNVVDVGVQTESPRSGKNE